MRIHTCFRPLVFFCLTLLCLASSPVTNARTTAISDTLSAISRLMFAERNEYFILVEAFKDGFIEEGKHYLFEYADPEVRINGKRLAPASEARYVALMRDFYSNGMSGGGPNTFRMESEGISLKKDILNPASEYRARGPWHHTNRKPTNQLIIEEMVRDGLIDTTVQIQVRYTLKGLTVNGRTLSSALEDKYKMLIRVMEGFQPVRETDIYAINR